MKSTLHKLAILKVLLLFQWQTQAQQIPENQPSQDIITAKATYTVTYQPNASSDARKKETMLLAIGKSSSVFYSAVAAGNDSLVNTLTASSTQQDIQNVLNTLSGSPRTDFSFIIFKKYAAKSIHYTQEIQNKMFEQVEKNSVFTWQLFPTDTATIGGYRCQKATTTYGGRRYVAWYTRHIPVADGPYKFNGLPGLIVKITDTQQQYDFLLTAFAMLATTSSLKPPGFPSFTIPATVQEIYKGQQNELYKIANNQTSASVSPAQRSALLQKIQAFTNRLERE